MDIDDLQPGGALWPKEPHPATGEPFVSGSIRRQRDFTSVFSLGPGPPPDREEVEYDWYDDDDYCVEVSRRTLSDDEYEAKMAEWRAAVAEHERTGGVHCEVGPVVWYGDFETRSGATAKMIAEEPPKWIVVETSASFGRSRTK